MPRNPTLRGPPEKRTSADRSHNQNTKTGGNKKYLHIFSELSPSLPDLAPKCARATRGTLDGGHDYALEEREISRVVLFFAGGEKDWHKQRGGSDVSISGESGNSKYVPGRENESGQKKIFWLLEVRIC